MGLTSRTLSGDAVLGHLGGPAGSSSVDTRTIDPYGVASACGSSNHRRPSRVAEMNVGTGFYRDGYGASAVALGLPTSTPGVHWLNDPTTDTGPS